MFKNIFIYNNIIDRFIGKCGILLKKIAPKLYCFLIIFKSGRSKAINLAHPYSLMPYKRLSALYSIAEFIEKNNIRGDFVECGVWNGGSAGVVASVFLKNQPRKIWLFDSWEGLPTPSAIDTSRDNQLAYRGQYYSSLPLAKKLFKNKIGYPQKSVRFIKGWYKDTILKYKKEIDNISLLHLDCDIYESDKLCLENLFDKVITGGFIVIDDYGYWRGCKKAVDEFIKKRKLKIKMHKIDSDAIYFRK